jgi:hypothetical protein
MKSWSKVLLVAAILLMAVMPGALGLEITASGSNGMYGVSEELDINTGMDDLSSSPLGNGGDSDGTGPSSSDVPVNV